jgi:DNA-binding NarL/FixJ family response regulator
MIVEDEVLSAMAIRMKLIKLGYDVCDLVGSGEEAVGNVAKEKPDIVLMDISLRGEIDGIEAANQIKSRFGTPIAFLTGYQDQRTTERAERVEHFGYFVKPVAVREIHSAIQRLIL